MYNNFMNPMLMPQTNTNSYFNYGMPPNMYNNYWSMSQQGANHAQNYDGHYYSMQQPPEPKGAPKGGGQGQQQQQHQQNTNEQNNNPYGAP
eukprot:UN16055